MISRHWTGLAKPEMADAYVQHLKSETFKKIEQLDGFISAQILQRQAHGGVEFLVVTNWESIDAIKQFAGTSFDVAVVPEFVQEIMIRYDHKVKHFEVTDTHVAGTRTTK